jgi:Tfp pilus assembly protein PilO
MTATFYLLTLILPLATVLIVFAMRYYAIIQQAKARLANDDAYRQLAQSAATAQSQIAASLAALEADVSDVRTRMAAVETILKAVE